MRLVNLLLGGWSGVVLVFLYAPIVLLILAWVGIHGIITACTRFRLPIDPFLFLLAASAIVHLLGRGQRHVV